ncbi:MAG: hypothetical protein ACR2K3_14455 [Nocardioides sp.]
MRPGASRHGPVHVRAEVLATKALGAHRQLTLVAEGVGAGFRPGAFVALSVGEARLARRAYWIHRVRAVGGHAAALDLVVEPRGPGSRWLADLTPGARLDLTGPLGRPFSLPAQPVRCVLIGEGSSAAPLLALVERLRERGCGVHLVLTAADEARLMPVLEARRSVPTVSVLVGDTGSQLGKALDGADVVYAAGSTGLLAEVAAATAERGLWCQVALEQPLPCATGLCQGCPVPVHDDDGAAHLVRSCADGPVFRSDRVDWAALA